MSRDDEDRKTIAERYGEATHTEDLSLRPRRVGDADILIAAGLCYEGVGTALYRVRAEWDQAAGDYRLARAYLHRQEAEARVAATRARALHAHADRWVPPAGEVGPPLSAMYRRQALTVTVEAARALAEAAAAARSQRRIVANSVKTLGQAKLVLASYALRHAARRRFQRDEERVLALSSLALQMWLDASCPACQGRGFNGARIRSFCPDCNAVGSITLSPHDPSQHFVRGLLTEMDRKCETVDRRMRDLLSTYSEASDQVHVWAEVGALQRRLRDLRSTTAEAD